MMRSAGMTLALAFALGCAARNELICSGGSSCTCPSDTTCSFSTVECGPTSCSMRCGARTACSGNCADSCSITCERDATCDVSVGTSGSVSCAAGSACHVTCPHDCSVSCDTGASCTLRCATDLDPRAFTGSASCP